MQSAQALAEGLANDLVNRGFLRQECFDLAVQAIAAHFAPVVQTVQLQKAERDVDNREIADLHNKLALIAQMAGVTS